MHISHFLYCTLFSSLKETGTNITFIKKKEITNNVSLFSHQIYSSVVFSQKLTKEVQTTLAEANKVAEETISSMRTVRSFANEHGESDSYYAKMMLMFQLNKKQALAYACYMWCSSVSVGGSRGVAYGHLNMSANRVCLCLAGRGAQFRGGYPLLWRPPRH